MKLPLELFYGLGAAVLLIATAILANTDLPTTNGFVAQFVWRGPWLIPYASYLLATWHRRRQGSKENAIGIQFVVALWTIGWAALLTALLAGINTQFNQPSEMLADSVAMTVGLWEELIKGLIFAAITSFIFERLRDHT